ncbi:hypothetical protein ACLOJK_005272, partial [Asimina triloba]
MQKPQGRRFEREEEAHHSFLYCRGQPWAWVVVLDRLENGGDSSTVSHRRQDKYGHQMVRILSPS